MLEHLAMELSLLVADQLKLKEVRNDVHPWKQAQEISMLRVCLQGPTGFMQLSPAISVICFDIVTQRTLCEDAEFFFQ